MSRSHKLSAAEIQKYLWRSQKPDIIQWIKSIPEADIHELCWSELGRRTALEPMELVIIIVFSDTLRARAWQVLQAWGARSQRVLRCLRDCMTFTQAGDMYREVCRELAIIDAICRCELKNDCESIER